MELTVETARAAVGIEEFAIGENRADVGFGIEVVTHPAERELRILIERGIARIIQLARRFVIGDNQAERQLANFAGELGAVARIDDRPRVHQVDRTLEPENLLTFEKE